MLSEFQEHHFEISTRAVAYIDMTRILQGNQTLEVFSSPLLREVVRKAINRIKHSSGSLSSSSASEARRSHPHGFPNVQWKSTVSSDEPSFVFLGNLGIPFIRLCVSNTPEVCSVGCLCSFFVCQILLLNSFPLSNLIVTVLDLLPSLDSEILIFPSQLGSFSL
jgi:hypothetical protein